MVFSIPAVAVVCIPVQTYHVLLLIQVIDIIGKGGKIVVYDGSVVYKNVLTDVQLFVFKVYFVFLVYILI